VNTLPEPTLEAFADHGVLDRTIDTVDAIVKAKLVMDGLEQVGVNLVDVGMTLETEGVASFVKSFDELLATLEEHRRVILLGTAPE
jgi:transaldolase